MRTCAHAMLRMLCYATHARMLRYTMHAHMLRYTCYAAMLCYAMHAHMHTCMYTHMRQWEEHCVEYDTVDRRQTRIDTERVATALAKKGLVPGDFGMIQVTLPYTKAAVVATAP